MDDGVSINVATSAITAIGGGGLGALLMRWFGGGAARTKELEARVVELEKNDARQTALLESIDRRLETLTKIFMEARPPYGGK